MGRVIIYFLLLVSTSLWGEFELTVCTIFQNEAPHLAEWIIFHRAQGVQHFFLYNNNSSDNYHEVLDPYIKEGIVTLIQWPYTYTNNDDEGWRKIQFGAYMDCITKHTADTQWLAVIDSDEYLFCPSGCPLPDFLKNYQKFGGVCVNWVRYGTSHIDEIPQGKWMAEVLTYCNSPTDRDRRFVKSIVQPRFVTGCINAHTFNYVEGRFAVNSAKEKVEDTVAHRSVLNEIRINHYWTGTETDFKTKKIPSRYKRRNRFNTRKMVKLAKKCNVTNDCTIIPLLEKIPKHNNFQEIQSHH